MLGRRSFLFGVGAATLGGTLRPACAHDGPAYLSAASDLDGRWYGVALGGDGSAIYQFDLPSRGHSLALRPGVREAICFARRPGAFALVFDPMDGAPLTTIVPPENQHFSGHGVLSADGRVLLVSENDERQPRGVIGRYDAADGYIRLGEIETGGIGPHDVLLMPDGETLVVANGGFDRRHDAMGEAEHADIRSDLVYLDWRRDTVLDRVRLPADLARLSIRHLALTAVGHVVAALQDTSEAPDPDTPLGFLHRPGESPRWLAAPVGGWVRFRGYCGSVAVDRAGGLIAMSGPRGNCIGLWDSATADFLGLRELHDGCGLAAMEQAGTVLASGGNGDLLVLDRDPARSRPLQGDTPGSIRFDNHLLRVSA